MKEEEKPTEYFWTCWLLIRKTVCVCIHVSHQEAAPYLKHTCTTALLLCLISTLCWNTEELKDHNRGLYAHLVQSFLLLFSFFFFSLFIKVWQKPSQSWGIFCEYKCSCFFFVFFLQFFPSVWFCRLRQCPHPLACPKVGTQPPHCQLNLNQQRHCCETSNYIQYPLRLSLPAPN